MPSIIINRKSVRMRREKSITGTGQAWVCARDFLTAAGLQTPRSLNGDFLAQHLGADAVQTLEVNHGGDIHRLIYVHAEGLLDLCRLFHTGEMHRTAVLALKGISMALEVSFEVQEPVPAKVEPEVEPEVSTYDFNGMTLRVVQIDGEPWFVAADTCKALGLQGYASKHTGKLGLDERMVLHKSAIQNGTLSQLFEKYQPSSTLLSESGLYKLITRSDKPEAKPFQEWVTRDVLPSIRKTGSYSLSDGVEPAKKVVGEVVLSNRTDAIEGEFKAMVSTRFNRRTQQIAALQAELHDLEMQQEKDGKMLALLAA